MADGIISNVTANTYPDTRGAASVYRLYACEDNRTSPRYFAEKGRIVGCTRKYRFPWKHPDGSDMIPWAIGHALGYVDSDDSRYPPDCDRSLRFLYCTSCSIDPIAPKDATVEKSPIYHFFWATLKYETLPYVVINQDGTLPTNYYSCVVKPSTQLSLTYNGSFKFRGGNAIFSGVPYLTCQREYLVTRHEVRLKGLNKSDIALKLGRVNNDALTINTPTETVTQAANQVLFAAADYGRVSTNIRGEYVSDVQYRLLVRDGKDDRGKDSNGNAIPGVTLDFDKLLDKTGRAQFVDRVNNVGTVIGTIYNKTALQPLFPQ